MSVKSAGAIKTRGASWLLRLVTSARIGLLISQAGLLVVLVGMFLSTIGRTEGLMTLKKGESCDEVLVASRNVITATVVTDRGPASTDFKFAPGPAEWPAEKSLDLGQDHALGLKIIKFIRHANECIDWVSDPHDCEGPVLKLRLCGPVGGWVDEHWLAANLFGGEAVIGPTRHQLWPLPVATMVEDFLHPPGETETDLGTLSIHHAGRMYRVPVDGNVGRRVPLGATGIEVELVACFLDARPNMDGGFFSRSNQPHNPLLELMIYFPDRAKPVRQISFAQNPLLNLDGVHGNICPVRFWYHHSRLQLTPGAVFAQAPSGKLWCRPVCDGKYLEAVPVEVGNQVPIGGRFSIIVLDHIPQARREVSFMAVDSAKADNASAESAVLVEVSLAGKRHEVWLQREEPRYGTQTILTEAGPLKLTYRYQRLPLGCEVQLDEIVTKANLHSTEATDIVSLVQLTDPVTRMEEKCEIAMNRPLSLGNLMLYQTNQQQMVHGAQTSTLRAVYDPGRIFTYWGTLMVCTGPIIMCLMRAYRWKKARGPSAGPDSQQLAAA